MRKIIQIIAISGFLSVLSIVNCYSSQISDSSITISWQEMMDSTKKYQKLFKNEIALNWALQAERKAKSDIGENDTNYYNVIGAISIIYNNLGNLDAAIKYMDIRIKGLKNLLKSDNLSIAISDGWMAFFLSSKKDYSKAEIYYIETVDMLRRIIKNDNPVLAKSIYNFAYNYILMEEYQKSKPLLDESLEMRKRIYQKDHPDIASSLEGLALYYKNIKDFAKAEATYIEALDMLKRLFKTDHYIVAESISNLAYFYEEIYEFGKAEQMFNESTAMMKNVFKNGHPRLANSINDLGAFYYRRGKYSKAEIFYKESLEIFRNLYKGDQSDLASCLNNLANLYFVIGDYSRAEPYYNESYEMTKRIYKTENPILAQAISNFAFFNNGIGSFSKAESLFIESLEMLKRIYKSDHTNLALGLSKLATFYFSYREYRKAEPLLLESYEMNKRLNKKDNPALASSIEYMGMLYFEKGDFEKAEPLYLESLQMKRRIYKTDHPDLANSISNTAAFYNDKGDYAKSEPLFNEALEMKRRLFQTDNPGLAVGINNLAFFYDCMKDYSKAEPLYLEAYEMNNRMFKNDHPQLAQSINNLGYFYNTIGQFSKSENLFIKSVDMFRRLFKSNNPELARSIFNLALLYFNNNEYSKAEPYFKESIEMYKNIFSYQSVSLSESERAKYWSTMTKRFETFNSFVSNSYKENPEILGYALDNILFTKALIFNSTNKIKKRILESGDSVLIKKFNSLCLTKENLIKLYTLTAEEVRNLGYNIDSLEKFVNTTEKELSVLSEPYKQSYEKKKISWRSIQTLLKPDEAAIEIVRFVYRRNNIASDSVFYAVFIITDQTTENPDFVILENGKELEDIFYNSYRNNVKMKSKDSESFNVFWKKIYDKTKDYKKIYFSPDGIYNKLNISTLQVEPEKYLLDFQEIHQLNSTQDILLGYFSKQKETNIYNSAVLIGNPEFSLSPDKVKDKERAILKQNESTERSANPLRNFKLISLPGTEKEIKNISKYLKSKNWVVNEYTKADALKASVKSANNPRVLHIATHGLFLSDIKPDDREIFGMETKRMIDNPLLRSGLFFAGASNSLEVNFRPSGYDNGFLTAYEAMNLNLDKTELVVLSACETGLGEIKNGEGVYGLQRAFIQAGAKSIIMSLWSVSDEATQELMSTFYKEWLGGKTKRDAFYFAQMKLKEKYPAPYYWGAFVMVGE
jgi:CHAT domain-containing protein